MVQEWSLKYCSGEENQMESYGLYILCNPMQLLQWTSYVPLHLPRCTPMTSKMKKDVAEKHFSGIPTCSKNKENTFICVCVCVCVCVCMEIETIWKAHRTVKIGYLQWDCKKRIFFLYVSLRVWPVKSFYSYLSFLIQWNVLNHRHTK